MTKNKQCKTQGQKIGVFKNPMECRDEVAGCKTFMFSYEYPFGGCFCCIADEIPIKSGIWDIYTLG